MLGVVKELLHRGVKKGVQESRPGTSAIVRVLDQLVRVEHRGRAEQVSRESSKHNLLDASLVSVPVWPIEADYKVLGTKSTRVR